MLIERIGIILALLTLLAGAYYMYHDITCHKCLQYETYCTITMHGSGIGVVNTGDGTGVGPVFSSSTEEVECGIFRQERVKKRCILEEDVCDNKRYYLR